MIWKGDLYEQTDQNMRQTMTLRTTAVQAASTTSMSSSTPRGLRDGHEIVRRAIVRAPVRRRTGDDEAATAVVVDDVKRSDESKRRLRVDDALRACFPNEYPSATSAKRACRRGEVYVNGVRALASHEARDGDELEVSARTAASVSSERRAKVVSSARATMPEEVRLGVVYEDDHCAVVTKPHGLVTMGGGGGRQWSAERAAGCQLEPSAHGTEGYVLPTPRPAHRLDEPTGGLLIIAKTRAALTSLQKAFERREVKKRYRALLRGRPEQSSGCVETPVGGLDAYTEYTVVKTVDTEIGTLALVDFYPRTGRTHQIRRHSRELKCPILGDARYGARDSAHPDGLFLFASAITIPCSAMPWRDQDAGDLIVETRESPKFARAMGEL